MTVTELREALDQLIAQGHGAKDVVIFGYQWTEGACGHESIAAAEIEAASPFSAGDTMTAEVVVIHS